MSEIRRAGAPDEEITDAMLDAGVSVFWDCCSESACDFVSFAPEKFLEFVRRIFQAMHRARRETQSQGLSRELPPLDALVLPLPE